MFCRKEENEFALDGVLNDLHISSILRGYAIEQLRSLVPLLKNNTQFKKEVFAKVSGAYSGCVCKTIPDVVRAKQKIDKEISEAYRILELAKSLSKSMQCESCKEDESFPSV